MHSPARLSGFSRCCANCHKLTALHWDQQPVIYLRGDHTHQSWKSYSSSQLLQTRVDDRQVPSMDIPQPRCTEYRLTVRQLDTNRETTTGRTDRQPRTLTGPVSQPPSRYTSMSFLYPEPSGVNKRLSRLNTRQAAPPQAGRRTCTGTGKLDGRPIARSQYCTQYSSQSLALQTDRQRVNRKTMTTVRSKQSSRYRRQYHPPAEWIHSDIILSIAYTGQWEDIDTHKGTLIFSFSFVLPLKLRHNSDTVMLLWTVFPIP